MRKKLVLAGVMVIAVMVTGFSAGLYWRRLDYSDKTKHETDIWAAS